MSRGTAEAAAPLPVIRRGCVRGVLARSDAAASGELSEPVDAPALVGIVAFAGSPARLRALTYGVTARSCRRQVSVILKFASESAETIPALSLPLSLSPKST